MKICFFSDVHGNIFAFKEFLKDIKDKNIDLIVFGGDFFGYYYYVNEIIDKVRKSNIISILGNHDQYFLDLLENKIDENWLISKYGNTYKNIRNKISKANLKYILSLPLKYEIIHDGLKIGFFHGSPYDPLWGRIYPDTDIKALSKIEEYDVVFLGHTHHKMIRKTGNTIIINPGSLGQQRDGKGTSYVLFDTENSDTKFIIVKYDVYKLIEKINLYDKGNDRLKEVLLRKRI